MDWISLLRSQQQDFLRRVKKIKSREAIFLEASILGCHAERIQFPDEQFVQILNIARQKAALATQNTSNSHLYQQAEYFFYREQICEQILKFLLPQKFQPLQNRPADFPANHQFSYQLVANNSIRLQIHITHDPEPQFWQINPSDRNCHQLFLFLSNCIHAENKYESNVVIWGFLLSELLPIQTDSIRVQAGELLYTGGLSWCINRLPSQSAVSPPQITTSLNQNSFPTISSNWECWHTFRGHRRGINCLAFTPENTVYKTPSLLATGSKGEIKLWNLNTAELVCTLPEYQWSHSGLVDEVECLTFSLDGRMLISSSADSSIKIWHVGARDLVDILYEQQGRVRCMAFDPHQGLLVTGGDNRTILFWDLRRREIESRFSLPGMGVHSLIFNVNGDKLITGCYQQIHVWDTPTPQELYPFSPRPQQQINAHTHIVRILRISSDGKYLISASCDRTMKIWELATGELVRTLTGHEDSIHAIAIAPIKTTGTPRGHILASGSADRTIKIWHLETGEQLATLRGHQHTVTDLVFTQSPQMLVSTSLDRTIKIWRDRF